MTWATVLWTAVIPSLPLTAPVANWIVATSGLLLLLCGAALWCERDRQAVGSDTIPAEENAIGCAA